MKLAQLLILSSCFCIFTYSQVPPPPLFSGETYTGLYSASYDYQTNGSVRYLLQDPANPTQLFAVMMGVRDSTDPPPFNQRFTYVSSTGDGGLTWFSDRLSPVKSGFPQADLIGSTAYVTHHQGTPNTVKVFQDIIFGALSFTEFTPPPLLPNGTWAGITGNPTGSQITVVASVNNTGGPFPISKINSTNDGFTWNTWSVIPNISGPSGCHSLFSAPGGLTGLAGFNYDSLQINMANGTMYYYQSTNYGVTFDSVTIFFQPVYLGGIDTLYHDADAGMQGAFSSNEPHIVFGVYSNVGQLLPGNFRAFQNSKILHWSPSTGITTVADNISSPGITDTINNTLLAPRCQPVIGKLANGTLICAFTGLTRGHTQVVGNGQTFITGDIYVSYSTNNGLNWSPAGNHTNTSGIEEKQPSIVQSSSDNIVRIIYFRDMMAGYYALVNEVGKAPYYCIMKNTDLTGISVQSEIPVSYYLSQNFPNPFNPATSIKFWIPKSGFTTLNVYDINGRLVTTLINGQLGPGNYEAVFEGLNCASGIYFYTLSSGEFIKTNKMILVR